MTLLIAPSACRKQRDEDDVVARIGRAVISQADFRGKLEAVPPAFQSYVSTPHGRRQFLDVLIREKLILESAKADGVESAPSFQQRMGELKREQEEALREGHDYLLTKLWIERLRERGVVAASQDECRDYLKKNPVEIRSRHILLATAEEAEAVLDHLRAGGSFPEAAKKKSLDGETAVDGGRMPAALMGETLPELEILFKMGVGELAGPVRSKFGWHVLIKDGESKPDIKAVKDRIKDVIEKQKLDRHLVAMQGSFRVEVVDAQFK